METSESSNLTKLPHEFTLWFTFFKKSKDKQLEEFEDNLKEISSFGTAEEFWGIYQHMKRPSSLPRGCEFFLFKKGIRPLWEDEANQGGGRFFISVKKNQSNNKLWEDFLIATLMLGKDMDAVNGVVLNVRTYEVFISVWTKPLDDEQMARIRNWMHTSMDMPPDITIEYRKHPTNEELAQKHEAIHKEDTGPAPAEAEPLNNAQVDENSEPAAKDSDTNSESVPKDPETDNQIQPAENPIPESVEKPVINSPEAEADEKTNRPLVDTGSQSHEDF
jgi:translation initiation factor 4E